ncbi:hypothetical protein F5878DRAFT_286421 [Lentinula raphanica]|uniref:Uncharacterized protein n=1 Tax=Lentinula raphanica TaxID=153919 RepID=A0AA38P4H1_9AGAR|nr:hypothetical protein F5878DRAFT_286421 [Lentinula raphanica]
MTMAPFRSSNSQLRFVLIFMFSALLCVIAVPINEGSSSSPQPDSEPQVNTGKGKAAARLPGQNAQILPGPPGEQLSSPSFSECLLQHLD